MTSAAASINWIVGQSALSGELSFDTSTAQLILTLESSAGILPEVVGFATATEGGFLLNWTASRGRAMRWTSKPT